MSKKVVVIVDRGPMEKTAIVTWQHEIPVLEQVHGEGSVTVVDTSRLTDGGEALVIAGTNQLIPGDSPSFKVRKGKNGKEVVEIVSLQKGEPMVVEKEVARVPIDALLMQQLGLNERFEGDPRSEYARLESLYGLHTDERLPNVQVAYGRFGEGRFEAALGMREAAPA